MALNTQEVPWQADTLIQVINFRLWDKIIPIAFSPNSEPLIPLRVVGEMFNVDHEEELSRMIEANTFVFQQIEYIGWQDPEVIALVGHFAAPWIPLTVVPLWLSSVDARYLDGAQAMQTVHFVMMQLFSHPAKTIGTSTGDVLRALRQYETE